MSNALSTTAPGVVNAVDFMHGAVRYLTKFDGFAEQHRLRGYGTADHLCFKCGSHESYMGILEMLRHAKRYAYESIIGGRDITYLKLNRPLYSIVGPVYFLEISDQKPDGSQRNGFDHVEIYPSLGDMQSLVNHLRRNGARFGDGSCAHHETFDSERIDGLMVRIEHGPLIHKIVHEEMGIKIVGIR